MGVGVKRLGRRGGCDDLDLIGSHNFMRRTSLSGEKLDNYSTFFLIFLDGFAMRFTIACMFWNMFFTVLRLLSRKGSVPSFYNLSPCNSYKVELTLCY